MTGELGKEVPIGKITKELKALWAEDTARTNACMMNLAIFSEDINQLERNSQSISTLTRNHSCRALSIALDRNASEKSITSWVTAHCNMSNGKKTVCCEQLSFLLKGYQPGRLRNTVFSNLNSDLPLVFWWQGELSEVFEPRLYTLIDRFVFDSARWADPQAGYQRLLRAAADVQRRFVIQDLAWTRSYYVRLALASIFDEATAQQEFTHLHEVIICSAPGQHSTALLLLSWLATQAQWSYLKKDGNTYFFQSQNGQAVTATLKTEGAHPISLLSLRSKNAEFSVSYKPEDGMLHQQVTCPIGTHEMTSLAGQTEDVSLVAEQLSRGGKNALLRKTLPLFIEML